LADALRWEAKLFGSVAAGPVAKNLMRIFRLKEKARKTAPDDWFPPAPAGAPAAPFRTIGVVGAGVMGSGIAHWCAAHGFGVIMCDSSRPAIERGVAVIRELFADGVRRGKVTHEDAHRMTGGIGITTSLEDFEFCDLVIEAITEDVDAKRKVFAELSALTDSDCVLASTSSVCPIEELTVDVAHPERVIGLHFYNLVSRMPLVEIALSPHTSRTTAERALGLVWDLKKTPVITRSSPGGFLTRVLAFYLNEACALWEQGSTVEMIDQAMRLWGWPMGPMRLIDEIGIDVSDALFAGMAQYFPERFTRTKLCEQMMAASLLGRKNGVSSGFYEYTAKDEKPNPAMAVFRPPADEKPAGFAEIIQNRLNAVLVDEMKKALNEGVVKTAVDAELALLLGAGFPVFRPSLLDASPGSSGS
jgi:3-hydroxyacyl-CoA dehydrogenase/enoyl-CoA hydratase/3-hydroxybutyryl-CoA epimerase